LQQFKFQFNSPDFILKLPSCCKCKKFPNAAANSFETQPSQSAMQFQWKQTPSLRTTNTFET